MPSGKYLMEDFHYAGGLPVVLRDLAEAGVLQQDALTVNGSTIGENNRAAACYNRDVIYPMSAPLQDAAGIAVLRVSAGVVSPSVRSVFAFVSIVPHDRPVAQRLRVCVYATRDGVR
jgi:L-arabonate dehydrase